MRLLLFISFLLLKILPIFSQNNLTPVVIGSQGNEATSSAGNSVQFTVGEAIVLTANGNSGHILTQGFHQPQSILTNNPLTVYYSFSNASCFGLYDGTIVIDSIVGCDGNYTLLLNSILQDSLIFDSLLAQEYTLDISSGDGCTLTESIIISAEGDNCDIEFYNAFSPNDDGVNEYWHIEKVEAYPNNTVQIFDRWGVLLWTANGYNNADIRWEGKSKEGKEMLNGTYFYIFQADGFLNKGYVEITK